MHLSVGGVGASQLSQPSSGTVVSDSSSYGSVREQSVGDALRSTEAAEALAAAANLTGVERVEGIMQSNSVLLTRAILLQEA